MEVNEHIVTYCGKQVDAVSFFNRLGSRYLSYYYDYIKLAMYPQKAFDYVISHHADRDEEIKNAFQLESDHVPAKEKILNHYSSIKMFCILHHILYRPFCNILKKYPKENLFQALKLYMNEDHRNSNVSSEYVISGVSLQAICAKYQMDYGMCRENMKNGLDLSSVIYLGLVVSPVFPAEISEQLKNITPFVLNLSSEDFKIFLEQTNYSSEFANYIIFYRYRYTQILDSFNVYYIIHFFEKGWEELFGKEIQIIHRENTNIEDFTTSYQKLKKAARICLLEQFELTEEDLKGYYQEFYADYVKLPHPKDTVWSYNRRKILPIED